MLEMFCDFLSSLNEDFPYGARLNAMVLQILQRQAMLTELVQADFSIKLVRTEKEVPFDQRSTPRCLGLCLHVLNVDLCCEHQFILLLWVIDGNHFCPFEDKQLTISTIYIAPGNGHDILMIVRPP